MAETISSITAAYISIKTTDQEPLEIPLRRGLILPGAYIANSALATTCTNLGLAPGFLLLHPVRPLEAWQRWPYLPVATLAAFAALGPALSYLLVT